MDVNARLDDLLAEWNEREKAWGLADVPGFSRELSQVWASSDYVARNSLRDDTLLESLAVEGLLGASYETGELDARLEDFLAGVADEDDLSSRLRQFRKKQMMRIIWRDITAKAPLAETLEDLTELADCSIRQALSHLFSWAIEKSGTPRNQDGEQQELIILGMGKLGARELNLSSDIDLIFAFPDHGETDGQRPVPNEQFFTQLGRKLINSLSQQTFHGFVFRVDMRLRPFGDAGPLALSFDALENYYQSHAREWERYAMIKARAITGSDVNRQYIHQLLRPFVYRRYIDFGVIEAIRDMKSRIQQEMHHKGMDANIKLGRGGIREIEFIGQVFQLVHGGRNPDLQIRPILDVLQVLADKELLPQAAATELNAAYQFLRLSENRIQAWKDEQTHLLPADDEGRQRLAESMLFDDWAAFESVLEAHRDRVEQHFQQVFSTPHMEQESPVGPLQRVWSGEQEPEADLATLAANGFSDQQQALMLISAFRESSSCRLLSSQARMKLDRLMPLMLEAISAVADPVLTLERLIKLLRAIVRRTSYLELLLENPLALSQLVRLSSESSWVVNQLSKQPLLLDELLDPRRLYTPVRREELDAELTELLDRADEDDLEQQMELLRQFADGNRLRTAAADLTGAIPVMVVSDYLTEIAEVTLQHVLQLAWNHLVARHGTPQQMEMENTGFTIIGYGKLGGIELGYGSDLDMVFLHSGYPATAMTNGEKSVANDVFFARLGQRIIHLLTTRTPSGILYEADMRLRPNGNSGLLVSSLDAFSRYQREHAWTWEHQALVRARPIAGDNLLEAQFAGVRNQVLGQKRDPAALRQDVVDMREKMRQSLDKSKKGVFDLKQGTGGIADIEFMVQYAVLRWAHQYPDLMSWTDNIRLLETLSNARVLQGEWADQLSDAYRSLRSTYHRAALQEEPGLIPEEELLPERALVAEIWQSLMLSSDLQ